MIMTGSRPAAARSLGVAVFGRKTAMGLLTGALVAAGVVGGGAAVWAAGPKPQFSGGEIRGCVNENGRLRLIWDGHHCHGDEYFISWDRRGPRISANEVALPNGAPNTPAATAFNVTAALPAFAPVTGFSIALPGPGTYLISANVRGKIVPAGAALCYITANLAAGATTIPSSERLVVLNSEADPTDVQATAPIQLVYRATAPTTIQVQAARAPSCGAATTQILSDDNGASNIDAVRIGP
jgi:hypothetical protein